MKNLRVAIFTGNYAHIRDGVSLTLNRLVSHLESQNIPVLIFGPSCEYPALRPKGEFLQIPSVALPGRAEYRVSLYMPATYEDRLSEFNPSVIHIATPDLLGMWALRFAKKHNVRVVSSYHTHFPNYLKYYKLDALEPTLWRYLKWFYGSCDRLFVPSQSMLDTLREKGVKRGLEIWSRGVDTDRFSPEHRSDEWRTGNGIGPDDVVVLFLSRLVWEKDLGTVIDVGNKLLQKHDNVKIMIGGEGPARKEMQRRLPGAIFTGFVGGIDLYRVYANSDLFFFPSETETFGNVTLEALSSGIPAVVARAVGSSSIVKDGENGFLVEPGNVAGFEACLAELITNGASRREMSVKARNWAMNYKWEKVMDKLVSDYMALLEDRE
ncbi:MAG: glycosyltransferase family 1 protein [Balneolaceae bacterium]|nr:MAG: glycosyltransferase family 1 protein [Balneolaceae bacterium]